MPLTTKHRGMCKPRQRGSLKGATAALVEHLGGQRATARVARLSQQRIYQYTDPDHDRPASMPVELVALLEKAAGCSPITEWLAAEAGCLLVPVIGPEGDDPVLLAAEMARVGQHTSMLFARYAEALADDGDIGPDEARAMLVPLETGMRAAAAMWQVLRGIVADERVPTALEVA
jgi:hypothetical protein